GIAQLGERQTEDLKVACSIHAHRIFKILFSQPNLAKAGYCAIRGSVCSPTKCNELIT
ncbi:hypothetical protein PanWU01x14_088530, partial [Parasponia andersonii]